MEPKIRIYPIENFCLKCSGTSKAYLEESNIPTEVNKGVGIGAAVFTTATFATLSSGYAMSWVFSEWYICVLFGMLWGISIFNLDRFIVSATYKDGTFSFSSSLQTIVRFALAIGIAYTIAIPIELKLFEDELLQQSKIFRIEQETKDAKSKREIAYLAWRNEVEGKGSGAVRIVGEGPIATALKKEVDKLDNEISNKSKNVENLISTDKRYVGFGSVQF